MKLSRGELWRRYYDLPQPTLELTNFGAGYSLELNLQDAWLRPFAVCAKLDRTHDRVEGRGSCVPREAGTSVSAAPDTRPGLGASFACRSRKGVHSRGALPRVHRGRQSRVGAMSADHVTGHVQPGLALHHPGLHDLGRARRPAAGKGAFTRTRAGSAVPSSLRAQRPGGDLHAHCGDEGRVRPVQLARARPHGALGIGH